MSEHPDPVEAASAALAETARGDPGLVLLTLMHGGEALRIARILLREQPESVRQAVAVEHLLRAQDELRQCMRAWLLPNGPPATAEVSHEAQATLDAVLAARAIAQQ